MNHLDHLRASKIRRELRSIAELAARLSAADWKTTKGQVPRLLQRLDRVTESLRLMPSHKDAKQTLERTEALAERIRAEFGILRELAEQER